MAITQSSEKKRKSTGGRRIIAKSKKKYELSNIPTMPTIGKEDDRKTISIMGNKTKTKIKHALKVHVLDKKTNKCTMTELQTARENPANRNYARRNIITKGAIISTPLGDVRITSRPGQTGSLNAVLVEKK